MYRKLSRVWSCCDTNYIPNFDKVFPELKHIDSEEMTARFKKLDLEFYAEKLTSVKPIIRFTMPFAIILMLLMLIALPFVFLITGKWKYSLGDNNRILNWFRSLRLI